MCIQTQAHTCAHIARGYISVRCVESPCGFLASSLSVLLGALSPAPVCRCCLLLFAEGQHYSRAPVYQARKQYVAWDGWSTSVTALFHLET
jgi:hypothetical protein